MNLSSPKLLLIAVFVTAIGWKVEGQPRNKMTVLSFNNDIVT